MGQAAGQEVPERSKGVHPDLIEDKCQGLTPKKAFQGGTFSIRFFVLVSPQFAA